MYETKSITLAQPSQGTGCTVHPDRLQQDFSNLCPKKRCKRNLMKAQLLPFIHGVNEVHICARLLQRVINELAKDLHERGQQEERTGTSNCGCITRWSRGKYCNAAVKNEEPCKLLDELHDRCQRGSCMWSICAMPSGSKCCVFDTVCAHTHRVSVCVFWCSWEKPLQPQDGAKRWQHGASSLTKRSRRTQTPASTIHGRLGLRSSHAVLLTRMLHLTKRKHKHKFHSL